jgi:hypothetical protein
MVSVSLPVTQVSLVAVEDEIPPAGMGWEQEDLLIDATTGEVLFASTNWPEWLRQAADFKARGYTLRHASRPTGRLAPIVAQ